MKQPIHISVVIPLYNKQDYILRSVQSVLSQSHEHFELIIVDDGSTDRSVSRLANCSDPRVRYIYQENRGEGAARNRGIAAAKHGWIAFLDADDSWEKGFLSAIVEMTTRHPQSQLCATGYFIDDGTEPRVATRSAGEKSQLVSNYFGLAYQNQLPFCASSVAITQTALTDNGGFPEVEELGADQGMWCQLLTNQVFAFNATPLATYHQDASGRICQEQVPSAELPFSVRLQHALDDGLVCERQAADAHRYIAAHLLHLAKLNLQAGRWQHARKLIGDQRTRRLPKKRMFRQAQLTRARLALLVDQFGGCPQKN